MPKKEPVENYKLTKEMKAFQKNYSRLQKLNARLQERFQFQLGEAQETRKLLHQVETGIDYMLFSAPRKPTAEIEGQDTEMPDQQTWYDNKELPEPKQRQYNPERDQLKY